MIGSEFSYERGSGMVTYDPDATDPQTFIAELADKTGFQGRVLASTSAPDRERTPADGPDSGAAERERARSNR